METIDREIETFGSSQEALINNAKKYGLYERYNHNITAFDSCGERCVWILDNGGVAGYKYYIIGVIAIGDYWVFSYLQEIDDAIDAMNDADNWLQRNK